MSKKIPKKSIKRNPKIPLGSFGVLNKSDLNRQGSQNVFLYRFVYSSSTSFLLSLLMLVSFFLQGVDTVYANEPESKVEQIDSVEEISEEEIVVDEELEDTSIEEDGEVVSTDNDLNPLEEEDVTEKDEELEEASETVDELIEDEEVSDESSSEGDDASLDSSSSGSGQDDEENELDELVDEVKEEGEGEDSNEDIIEEEDVIEEDETSDETIDLTYESVSIAQSDSAFSFTKDECTQLANGSFYCLKPQENVLKDALFSAPDEDGDLEIYFVRDGIQVQVTKNLEDDASPYYDQNTNSIVWHRLIDGRYQIVLYDVEAGEETILTQGSLNNMEPNKQGDYVVWQRWVDNGWNIIFYDGKKEQQITTSSGNNVAPYIHGSLIVWNRHSLDGVKTIEIYNIDSRTYVTVDDPDGLSVSNPRMVFVYDSLAPNGDIVTKGYDLLAKKFIELDTLPIQLPDEIPESDSTGETRALIQSKPSLKSEIEEIIGSTGNSTSTDEGETEPVVPVVDEVLEDSMTLDMSEATTTPALDSGSSTIIESLTEEELAEFDLVIEPLGDEVLLIEEPLGGEETVQD